MKLSKSEYEKLIKEFDFFADKAESCYKNEVKEFLEQLKKDYLKKVVK